MKNILRYIMMLALSYLPCIAAAQHFEKGGIAYDILSTTEHTVEVAERWTTYYNSNINIPSTVVYEGTTYDVVALGKNAFYGATLTGITIPSSVTQIKERCFLFASRLSSINISAAVTSIEDCAFAATDLTTINIDENNPNYRSIDGMLFSKDTATLLGCPAGKAGAITLPQNTRAIAPYAFYSCDAITHISFPEGLTSIGPWAFTFSSNLNNLTIPSSVSYLGESLFGGCSSLSNLTLAPGNTHYYMDGYAVYSIGGDTLISYHKSEDSVFLPSTLRVVSGFNSNTDIKYIHFEDGVTTILHDAFGNSSLESIDLPSQMTLIDYYAFFNCNSLTHVGMPASLDEMGRGCFELCKRLTSINIPNNLRTIPYEAFYACESLSHITWGDAVEVIDTVAFGGCDFEELIFPTTLRAIRVGSFECFSGMKMLDKVVFSAPIDTIESETFYANKIGELRLKNETPPITTDYGCLLSATVDSIIIPCGSLNAYLEDEYWGKFAAKYREDCDGISNPQQDNIAIYPIPATDKLTIANAPGCHHVDIINTLGQTVRTIEVADSTMEIDVSALERGIYILCLHTTNGTATRRVVLQ